MNVVYYILDMPIVYAVKGMYCFITTPHSDCQSHYLCYSFVYFSTAIGIRCTFYPSVEAVTMATFPARLL